MSIRIKEALLIVVLIAFIIFINRRDSYKVAPIQTIADSFVQTLSDEELCEQNANALKKEYGITNDEYIEATYYCYESMMDVSQIAVIRVNSNADASDIISAITKKSDETKELFKSYAPDQYDLLDKAILVQKGDYVIYVVHEEASKAYSSIIKCIKE